jgi:polysaccharide export outer membrane protein
MSRVVRTAHVALLLFLVLGEAPAARGQTSAGGDQTPLAPGDVVRIRFWQEPELSGDYPVDETGRVALPFVGARLVTVWSAERVKQQLVDEYAEQLRNQPAQITLLRRIRVLGEVRTPGLYHVDATMELGDVVAMAGGTTPNGKMSDIRIMRGDEVVRGRLDQTTHTTFLRSGDQVVVPRRNWLTRNITFVLGAAVSTTAIILTRR